MAKINAHYELHTHYELQRKANQAMKIENIYRALINARELQLGTKPIR